MASHYLRARSRNYQNITTSLSNITTLPNITALLTTLKKVLLLLPQLSLFAEQGYNWCSKYVFTNKKMDMPFLGKKVFLSWGSYWGWVGERNDHFPVLAFFPFLHHTSELMLALDSIKQDLLWHPTWLYAVKEGLWRPPWIKHGRGFPISIFLPHLVSIEVIVSVKMPVTDRHIEFIEATQNLKNENQKELLFPSLKLVWQVMRRGNDVRLQLVM